MIFNTVIADGGGGGGGATHTIDTMSTGHDYELREDGAWTLLLNPTRNAGEVVVIRIISPTCNYRGRTSFEIHPADVFGDNGLTGSNLRYYAMFVMPDENITLI